jgi:lipopolysaccharide export system permease protein
LVGCLVGLGTLSNNSELTVMRAAGISLRRIVWSVMQAVAVFVVVAAILGEFVAPVSQQMAEIEQSQYKGVASTKGFWLREGNDYTFVQSVSSDGALQGVSRYRFTDNDWQQTLVAEKGVYEDQQWTLEQVQKVWLENQNIIQQGQENMAWPVSLQPHLLSILSMDPKHLAIGDLVRYGQYLDQSGLDTAPYDLAFWKKILQPLATLALVFVAISFVFGSTRSVTLGQRVLVGVIVGLAFNYAQEVLGPASSVFGFTPLLAYLVPILLSVVGGAWLLRKAG